MTDDLRVYLMESKWQIVAKADDQQLYCHLADEKDGYYHRIAATELYLTSGTESYCLNCAYKRGIISRSRPQLSSKPIPERRDGTPQ